MTTPRIHKNAALCRKCGTTVSSIAIGQWVACNCGSISISGGNNRLVRSSTTWYDLEELSEYEISWRYILDFTDRSLFSNVRERSNLAKLANNAKYSYFAWSDEHIYFVNSNGIAIDTGKTLEDLKENSPPCIVKAYYNFQS